MNADESAEMARSIVQSREALGISIVARRARHAVRDGAGRSGDGARLRPGHRRRHAARRPARPGGAARLPRVRRGITGADIDDPVRAVGDQRADARMHLRADRDGVRDRLQGDQRRELRPRVDRDARGATWWRSGTSRSGSSERSPQRRWRARWPPRCSTSLFVRPLRSRARRRRRAGDHDDRAEHPARDRARAASSGTTCCRPARRGARTRPTSSAPRSRRRASRRRSSRWC